MSKVVGVMFDSGNKIYNFINEVENIKLNDLVIVDTENGLQKAIIKKIYSKTDKKPLKKIVRLATKKDLDKIEQNRKDALDALEKCKSIAEQKELKMRIVDAKYNYDRSQLTFHFLADNRVDFRELVKKLASLYKTRIELRQIGVRDKAKEIGGIGVCGNKLCCASHLKNFNSVSINMAKNQNISLNPTKINGVCGRLLCCLMYENDNYSNCRKKLPQKGEFINLPEGRGRVISQDCLNGTYDVELKNKEIITKKVEDC